MSSMEDLLASAARLEDDEAAWALRWDANPGQTRGIAPLVQLAVQGTAEERALADWVSHRRSPRAETGRLSWRARNTICPRGPSPQVPFAARRRAWHRLCGSGMAA